MSAVLTRSVIFIGVGLCGCRQVKELMGKGYEGFLLNTSETDFKLIGEVSEHRKYKIPDSDGVDKDRDMALELFGQRLEEISTYILKANSSFQHYVFVFSTGGGTGSGGAPALAQHFGSMFEEEEKEKTVSIIATNPDEKDGWKALNNSKECIKYIETECDTVKSKIYIDNSKMGDKFAINSQVADLIDGLMQLSNVDSQNETKSLEKEGMKQTDDRESLALWRTQGCVNMAIINTDRKEPNKELVETVEFMPQYSKKPMRMAISLSEQAKIDAPLIREELIKTLGNCGTEIKFGHNQTVLSYAYTFGHKTPKDMLDRIDGMITNIKNQLEEQAEKDEDIDFNYTNESIEDYFGVNAINTKSSKGSPFSKKGSPFGSSRLGSKR